MTTEEHRQLYKTVPGVYRVLRDGEQHPSFQERFDAEKYVDSQGGVGFRIVYSGDYETPRDPQDVLPGGRIERYWRY